MSYSEIIPEDRVLGVTYMDYPLRQNFWYLQVLFKDTLRSNIDIVVEKSLKLNILLFFFFFFATVSQNTVNTTKNHEIWFKFLKCLYVIPRGYIVFDLSEPYLTFV